MDPGHLGVMPPPLAGLGLKDPPAGQTQRRREKSEQESKHARFLVGLVSPLPGHRVSDHLLGDTGVMCYPQEHC